MWENIIKGKTLRSENVAKARELIVTSLYCLCLNYSNYIIDQKLGFGL